MFSTINETKTPSELVEWLRLWANGYEDGDALDDNDARQIADAVERVCAPCNAAVTREALMKAKLYFDHRGEGTNLDDAGMAIDAITSIDAALAAPPRNCDRFATAEEAYSAWMPAVEMDAICDWLFAPAKEEKEARRG
jgi:hypothetical protein